MPFISTPEGGVVAWEPIGKGLKRRSDSFTTAQRKSIVRVFSIPGSGLRPIQPTSSCSFRRIFLSLVMARRAWVVVVIVVS